MTEKTALARLGRGQEEALAWVIRRYPPYVCAVIRPILGQSMTEADVDRVYEDIGAFVGTFQEKLAETIGFLAYLLF